MKFFAPHCEGWSCLRTLPLIFAFSALVASLGTVRAANEGTITGRIFSPASGEYLRNAQIRVDATGQVTTSEDGGTYRLSPVAAGPVTLIVTYTGFRPITTTVQVPAEGTVTRDFELISTLQAPASGTAGPTQLAAFTVSTEREGNAKAIMDQRNSMNITNSVASDVFGDVAEGNVGEFLKHMPGVELDLTQGEVRTIRLRGLDSEYTQVTLDGAVEFFECCLVGRRVMRRQRLRQRVEFNDNNTLLDAGLIDFCRHAAHQETPAISLHSRWCDGGVSRKGFGFVNRTIAYNPVGFGHEIFSP
jgi:hypothetical protein